MVVVARFSQLDDEVTISDVYVAMKYYFNQISRPMWVEPGTGRQRVAVEACVSHAVTLASTVVSSVTNIDGFDGKDTILNHMKKTSWSLGVRNRIS